MRGLKYAGPCTRDCPKRHYLYCPTCEAWKAEKGQRIEGYDKRVETSDLRQKTAGGAKNCRRIAEARSRGRNHLR